MAAIKRRRTALTVRQLVEDYLTHQLTRPVTQVSTRHHLNQLLALYGAYTILRATRPNHAGRGASPMEALWPQNADHTIRRS